MWPQGWTVQVDWRQQSYSGSSAQIKHFIHCFERKKMCVYSNVCISTEGFNALANERNRDESRFGS